MEHRAYFLDQGSVEVFRNTIVLWCVMRGESSDRSSLSQVFREFSAEVFSTSIASQFLDLRSVLCLQPCLVIDIVVKDFVFLLHEVDLRVSRVVIGKCDHIFHVVDRFHRCWSPNV